MVTLFDGSGGLTGASPTVIALLGSGLRTFIGAWYMYGEDKDRLSWIKPVPVAYTPRLLQVVDRRLYFVVDSVMNVYDAAVRKGSGRWCLHAHPRREGSE
jgi:hypothetical protein